MAGTATLTHGAETPIVFTSTEAFSAGLNGFGSNNDAWSIDNYSIDAVVPEPGSLMLLGMGGALVYMRRKR